MGGEYGLAGFEVGGEYGLPGGEYGRPEGGLELGGERVSAGCEDGVSQPPPATPSLVGGRGLENDRVGAWYRAAPPK